MKISPGQTGIWITFLQANMENLSRYHNISKYSINLEWVTEKEPSLNSAGKWKLYQEIPFLSKILKSSLTRKKETTKGYNIFHWSCGLIQWWFSNVLINLIFECKSFELWQLNSIFLFVFFQYSSMTDVSKVQSANYNFSKIFSSHFSLIAMEFLFLTLFKLTSKKWAGEWINLDVSGYYLITNLGCVVYFTIISDIFLILLVNISVLPIKSVFRIEF